MINLLPTKEKKELKLCILERNIIIFGSFLISIILFLIICLVIIYLALFLTQSKIKQSNILFSQAQELEKQVNVLNKELSGFINQRLEHINQIEKEKIYWSQVLEKLAEIIPKNTYLALLEIDEKVKIGGHAKTRDDVLLFQKILEQEEQFTEIDSPLSNFVKQKNVDFHFSFKINHEN